MAIADFGAGVQAVLRQRMLDQIAAQDREEKIRQFNERLGMDQARVDQDAAQFDVRAGLDRDRFGLDQSKFDVEQQQYADAAPQRDAQTGYLRTQSRYMEEAPLRAEAERQADEAAAQRQHRYRLGEIAAQGANATQARPTKDVLAEYEAKKQIDAKYTGARPSLGAERNTLNYFNRMLEAERNARAVENEVSGKDVAIADVPLVPGLLENFLRSEAGQKYTQAQRAYTEARLRKESGAAIPQSEFETDRKTNFRTLGDKPETIKQKRAMRLQTIRGIGNAAGNALQEYYGPGTTLDSLLQEFADQEAAATPAAQGGTVPMIAPDGRRLNVPADKVAELEAKGAKRR